MVVVEVKHLEDEANHSAAEIGYRDSLKGLYYSY